MSEPITLYAKDGQTLTVYTRSQAADRLASGEWYAEPPDAAEDGAGVVTVEDVEESPAPEPKPRTVAKKTAAPRKGL